jgi:ribosomal protein L16 Arg81 hydroxylase
MNITELFGGFPLNRFVDEHLHRLPLALPGACHAASHFGSWKRLGALLGADSVDVLIARQGQRHEAAAPTDVETAKALVAEGCTIVVRHAEQHDEELLRLARSFAETFRSPVNVHVYATPPGSFGFSWHYDAEDVFILQLTGQKEYQLRKNTVNPWPLEETIPLDMRYERENMPLIRVLLSAGDLLYIPCGWWHRAEAAGTGETAISLAIGVMSPSAMEVFDLLRNEALHSVAWRQRLPVALATTAAAENRAAAIQFMLEQLASDTARIIKSRAFLDRVIGHLNESSDIADCPKRISVATNGR